jgi:hypothetical protein
MVEVEVLTLANPGGKVQFEEGAKIVANFGPLALLNRKRY